MLDCPAVDVFSTIIFLRRIAIEPLANPRRMMSDFYCLAPRLSIAALLSKHLMHERNRRMPDRGERGIGPARRGSFSRIWHTTGTPDRPKAQQNSSCRLTDSYSTFKAQAFDRPSILAKKSFPIFQLRGTLELLSRLK